MDAHLRTLPDSPWRRVLLVAIASLALPAGVLRAGDVYRSVDAQGHVVYSDQADTSAGPQSTVEIDGGPPVADVGAQATEAPPPLPDYDQPPCPEDGYLWTPGYWGWSAGGYYWVPGNWVQPPQVGVLWTPGYWGFVAAVYVFHRGYWAPHIGYYGGINYGFGYFGTGFAGGRWVGNSFAYNRTVSNVDTHVFHHTYDEPADHNAIAHSVSYNGGPDGTKSAPTAQERAVAAERHIPPTLSQRQNVMQAARTPALMPHMSTTVNRVPGAGADHHTVAVNHKPAFSAPAVVAAHTTAAPTYISQRSPTRVPPSTRVFHPQVAVTRPSTPAVTRNAATRPQHPLH